MSSTASLHADGSAPADAQRVEVNRKEEPYRWRCPNGHSSWDRTDSHLWCASCSRSPDPDLNPEHWELLDTKTGETVPYAAVELVDK